MKDFNEIFEDKTKFGTKLKTDEYHQNGKYPIVDQGQNLIAGYTDKEDGVFKELPAIIFGDHTRIIKYIDQPFFIGADGVKILRSKIQDANYKYLYYALKSVKIPNTGYNRHFKWIKASKIIYPDKEIQERVVYILDKLSEIIRIRKKEQNLLDNLIKSRFIEMFGDPLSNEMCWEQAPLSACIESIDNGKSFVCDSEAREGDWPAVLKLSAATYGYYRPEENKAIFDKSQFIEDAAVRVGDLLFTRKNTPELVGMCAYVYDTPSNLMMPDLIFRLNTNKRCNKIFLWKLINHNLFRDCIQAIATGSAKSMSNISKERLLGLKIILPPIKLQKQFAAFVAQTDKSKLIIQKSSDELKTLYKLLFTRPDPFTQLEEQIYHQT